MTTRKPLFISALGLCLAMVLLLSFPREIQEEVVREEVEEEWWEDEPPTVREVLMALYESTDGENWVVNAGKFTISSAHSMQLLLKNIFVRVAHGRCHRENTGKSCISNQ